MLEGKLVSAVASASHFNVALNIFTIDFFLDFRDSFLPEKWKVGAEEYPQQMFKINVVKKPAKWLNCRSDRATLHFPIW